MSLREAAIGRLVIAKVLPCFLWAAEFAEFGFFDLAVNLHIFRVQHSMHGNG